MLACTSSSGRITCYFYGVAQPAMWEALKPCDILTEQPTDTPLRQTALVANHHMLFGKTKASSSGKVKPPTGEQLLEHYTVEQLRAHFLALGLDSKSVGFSPKPFDPDEAKRNDPRVADPVLKEGALLTNVFNRLARSCFYEAQKSFDGCMPLGPVTPSVVEAVARVLQSYEATMHRVELHSIMSLMDEFIRYANKHWTDGITAAQKLEDAAGESASNGSAGEKALAQARAARRQVLVDSFFLLRVCTLLMHPVVPKGCRDHLRLPVIRLRRFLQLELRFRGHG